jgi:hypothetical protein
MENSREWRFQYDELGMSKGYHWTQRRGTSSCLGDQGKLPENMLSKIPPEG